jgi:xylan 1,4-beta-xylosidase
VVTARAKVARIEQTWRATLPAGEVTLRMGMAPPPTGFSPDAMGGDRIRLLAVAGQDEVLLAELDGRYWTAETTASSTGRVITCTPVREW